MTPSAAIFLFVTTVVLPVLAYLSKRHLDRGVTVQRIPFYVEAIVLQTILLAGSFYVALRHRLILFRPFDPDPSDLLFAAGLLFVALITMLLGWRIADAATKGRVSLLVPATVNERIVWAAVSLVASVAEEVAYRGVMVTLLHRLLRNWWIAAALSSIFFALAHLLQGWKSAAIVAIFGFFFHLLVMATSGLYLAILVHFAYDLAAGWTLGSWTRRRGEAEARGAHESAL